LFRPEQLGLKPRGVRFPVLSGHARMTETQNSRMSLRSSALLLLHRFLKAIRFISSLLAGACIALNVSSSYGQTQMTTSTPYATKYFRDTPPAKNDFANLPPQAQQIIVAKVHLSNGFPILLVQRDQSGLPSSFVPKTLFRARIELVNILRGDAKNGDQFDVF